MYTSTLTFIGAGNMASAIIGGLLAGGYDPQKILACDLNIEKLSELEQRYGIKTSADTKAAIQHSDTVIFAVKPQHLKDVALGLADVIQQKKPLVLSIAAMVPTSLLAEWLGGKPAIVRCMPNTPALIRCGATGMYANSNTDAIQKKLAESILQAIGITVWINDETQMDAVTALSGCGPAYFFLFMEYLQATGEKLGLTRETARLLTLQTALGAAKLASTAEDDLITLRKNVTSSGGSTERAMETLTNGKLAALLETALTAAEKRAEEMVAALKN